MTISSCQKHRHRGFTIIELMIVIIVIGILAALVLIGYTNISGQAKAAGAKADLLQASKQLGLDKVRGGTDTYPPTLASANSGNGMTANNGFTFTYNPPQSSTSGYCLSSTNGTQSYFVTQAGSVMQGTCPNQTPRFQPTDIPGLVAWWRAEATGLSDGANVTSWIDLSGNGNTAVPSGNYYAGNAAKYVLRSSANGKPSLNFPGNSGYATQIVDSYSQVSIFAVTASTAGNYDHFILYAKDGLAYGFRYGGTQVLYPGTIYSSSAAATNGSWSTVGFSWDSVAGNYVMTMNGKSMATGTNTQAAASSSSSKFLIGHNPNSVTTDVSPFIGQIADIVLYNKALSATERAQLDTYAQERYGISVNDYIPY